MSHFGNWVRDYIAGWIGGIAGLVAGHPFETVKIRQQTSNHRLMKAITITYTHEGLNGFYKGIGFPLMTVGFLNAIYFGAYSNTLRVLQKNYDEGERLILTNPMWRWQVFTAGCVGGFVQVLCSCPVEVVKSKLQVHRGNLLETYWKLNYPQSSFACENTIMTMKDIKANSGFRGFYRGLVPMMWRDLFTSGIYILTYEVQINDIIPQYFEQLENSPVKTRMVAGGLAGVASWSLAVPFDVVKSRLQTDRNVKPKYKGAWDCMVKIYRQEGISTFKKGFAAIIVRAFVSNAMIFLTYEKSAQVLADYVL